MKFPAIMTNIFSIMKEDDEQESTGTMFFTRGRLLNGEKGKVEEAFDVKGRNKICMVETGLEEIKVNQGSTKEHTRVTYKFRRRKMARMRPCKKRRVHLKFDDVKRSSEMNFQLTDQ